MSRRDKLAENARERKSGQDKKSKNNEGNRNYYPANKGGIEGLDMFDYVQNRMNVSRFNEAKRKLVNYVGTKFGRNAHPIEFGEEYVIPEPVQPEDEELDEANDPHGFKKAEYLEERRCYVKRSNEYEDNKSKVYQIIWTQCTVSMRNMLKRLDSFVDIETDKDPLALWLEIYNVSLQGTSVADDKEKRIMEAMRRFQSVHQAPEEPVGDWNERYEGEYQAFRSAGGKLVETIDIEEYGDDIPENIKDQIQEKQIEREENQKALYFITKLHKGRFGGLSDDLQNAMDRGRNEYPKTLTAAYQMAINYRTNGKRADTLVVNNNREQYGAAFAASGKEKKGGRNYHGNRNNHNGSNHHDSDSKDGEDSAQKGVKCYLCNEFGHVRRDCPILKKAVKYLDSQNNKTAETLFTSGAPIGGSSAVVNFMGCTVTAEVTSLQTVQNGGSSLPFNEWDILLDSQSSANVICNRNLIANLRKSDVTLIVYGVDKNGEPLKTNIIGEIPWFGTVYYHPKSRANILSFHDVAKKFQVEFDNAQNAFHVKLPNGDVKSFQARGKHYCYNAKQSKGIALIDTVEEKKLQFTQREVQQARLAADLYEILGRPSYKDFYRMVAKNYIKDCPVNARDISRAIEIWGRDLGTIKGKTTRETAKHVPEVETVGIFEDKSVIICADLCKILGLEFLVTISRRLCLMIVVYLSDDRGVEAVKKALLENRAIYGRYGVGIKAIYCDGEGAIGSLKPIFESEGCKVEVASKSAHVPEVERAIRVIKERVRAFVTTLPYKLPIIVLIHVVYYQVTMINHFPKTSSVDPDISPKMLLTGVKIDYKRDCQLKLGEYVQVHDEDMITNTMKERTLGAICLGPVGNAQGSYNFLSLKTWRVIKRKTWVSVPMPQHVIELLNQKAKEDVANLKKKGVNYQLEYDDDPLNVDENPENPILENENEEPAPVVPIIEDQSADPDEESSNSSPEEEVVQVEELEDSGVDIDPANEIVEEAQVTTSSEPEQEEEHIKGNYNLRPPRIPKWKMTLAIVEKYILMNMYVNNKVPRGVDYNEALVSLTKEMLQMHTKKVFHPVFKQLLTKTQLKKLLRSLMFMKRKRDGRLKSRFCCNGKGQDRNSLAVDPSSPTVSTESLFITFAIEAMEERFVRTIDIEGAYLHVDMKGDVYMVIDPFLTDILASIDETAYRKYINEDGTMIVMLDKALYGCPESARLFNEHLVDNLKKFGFIVNPYDPCVLNKIVNIDGHQCTVTIHVDDLKISCKDEKYLDQLVSYLIGVYGKLNVHCEKVLDYLGMDVDYTESGIVRVSMEKMLINAIENYGPVKGADTVVTPATQDLFTVEENLSVLGKEMMEKFHSIVALLLYVAKRARPDLLTAVSFLSTRVLYPTEQDWRKLGRVIKYIKGTMEMRLSIRANMGMTIEAYIDASFATHMDRFGHSGMYVTLGVGPIYCKSSKQRLVCRSSTESELVAVGDGLIVLIWIRNFIIAQGYTNIGPIKVYQDNMSTITLINKGRSTSQRTRHIDIRYFFIYDRIGSGEVVVVFMGTLDMLADYFSKAVNGGQFIKFLTKIMGLE